MSQLHDYMRQKILLLGKVTGLYYSHKQTETEKDTCELLTTGFGKYPGVKKDVSSAPITSLKTALSSKECFETFYTEVAIKSMRLFTEVKRLHLAMVVGIDLAKFYLEHGKYSDAEPLLEKAWGIYKQQKWETLYTDVLMPLAACQLKHKLYSQYLSSVTLLSCVQCLPFPTRQYYSNELIKLCKDDTLKLPVINTDPVFTITDVRIDLVKNKGHIGDTVNVYVKLTNQITEKLSCKYASISLRHCDLNNPRSFSDEPTSPRKTIFDQTDYGMHISLASIEKPKEAIKEPLTPSNILKRIKSHRRTWSRNKNEIRTDINVDVKVNSSPSSDSVSRTTSPDETVPLENVSSVKKALFPAGDSDVNSNISSTDETEKRLSLLEMSKSNGEAGIEICRDVNKTSEINSNHINNDSVTESSVSDKILQTNCTTDKMLTSSTSDKSLVTCGTTDKPLATSSTSDKSLITSSTTDKSLETSVVMDKPFLNSSTSDKPLPTGTFINKPLATSSNTDTNSVSGVVNIDETIDLSLNLTRLVK